MTIMSTTTLSAPSSYVSTDETADIILGVTPAPAPTRFEDVKDQTTEDYFRGNQFAVDAFKKKYTAHDGETYVQSLWRVCKYIASAETTAALRTYWGDRWFDEIYNDWWHPAGSIMQGAASGRKISMANCTHVSLGCITPDEEWDNLESIIKNAAYSVAKMAAYRQGLGVDYSRLRPASMQVMNSANESSGAIHWMKFIDSIGYYVGQKGRIPAMLFSLSCKHPDVVEFCKVKGDKTLIQNANISVQVTNDFYKAVENGKDWDMTFDIPEVKRGQKVFVDVHSTDNSCHKDPETGRWYYIARKPRPAEHFTRTIPARELLEIIAKNMYEHAEPGIQNIDIARKYSNSDYLYDPNHEYDCRIQGTNACSEQYLSRDSLCVLASQNAGRFSTDPEQYEQEQSTIGESMNRFLDNVNEMELQEGTFATPHQKLAIRMLRRTGAGMTNIAAWLFKQNLEYGSPEGNVAVEGFMQRFNYHLYRSSIDLGKEKGDFGMFDRQKYEQCPFIKRMMGLGLKFETMRNVTCSSIAPTGTLSLMFRDLVFSYGIEPAFGMYYWKRTRISGKYEYYFCVPYVVREVLRGHGITLDMEGDAIKDTWDGKLGKPLAAVVDEAVTRLNIKFKAAPEVSPFNKLDMMEGVMKWCDSSISVTYMLPEGTNWKDVYDFILLANKKEVKSIAAFPDKKMYGIVSYDPFKDLAIKLVKEGIAIHPQNFSNHEKEELQSLTATIMESDDHITKTTAPVRPQSLNCDVHHIKFSKKIHKKADDSDEMHTFEYLVVVGLLHGEPFEIFAMENGFLDKKYLKGILTREKKGVYSVTFEDGTRIEDVTKTTSESEDMITRGFSMALRHGADISILVEQLEKAEVDPKLKMWSFSSAMARALKKYVKNGVKIAGAVCSNCGSTDIVRLEGCASCQSCGSSKCS